MNEECVLKWLRCVIVESGQVSRQWAGVPAKTKWEGR